jgi:hypothetical protein
MSESALYSGARIMATWANHDWSNGIQIESLDDFTEVHVRTRNSVYELTVIDGLAREVVVRGGRFFAGRTRAHLAGSSMGGGLLKLGGIYVGFSLELVYDEDTVITTHVRSISVLTPPAGPAEPRKSPPADLN